MRTGMPDLDDVEELVARDVDGLLQSVARAGAQVRAVAEAVREGVLSPLSELRPRSVVIVSGSHRAAAAAADLAVAVLAAYTDVPLVCVPALPGWVGPLDVVVILGDDAGDMMLADAAARAARRRAEVVVGAPLEGPLRDALGGTGIDLSPRIQVDRRFGFGGFVAVVVAVVTGLSSVRFTGVAPGLDGIADALDAEAAANHVSRESFHNQAKLLASRMVDASVVVCGDTPAAVVTAGQAAAAVLAVAGVVCAATDVAGAATLVRDRAGSDAGAPADSLFHDPFIDGPAPAAVTVLVLGVPRREWQVRRWAGALGEAMIVIGSVGGEADQPIMPGSATDSGGDRPADLEALLLTLLRVDMAAVYLRLIRGS
ncbi:hypothetical protein GII30_16150 [Gordonia amarae]|uniref:TobH protein n=2 Tax=Gordonia amarae TaxID=36821 RepID=G7GVC2_9ACTN|nr:hypothetical protein [Gordonia amarae]MCS3879941.1 hypothetical protein [Gordonia amarae]QHN18343.1 hypothetical protein GII35_16465 [Gordonia amarae]QHN22825.1 hypothetical protein GII34_16005 [Gordonia amarae]QHN31729.1 hypothetical protein GII32_16315 [Gordonia amarae]QHN40474.1 hypothetical protein GII30_16150 [Gordonia amarae]